MIQMTETTIVVAYPVTLDGIREKLAPLALADGYGEVVKGIAMCRTLRGEVEARRKYLKADSLAYGRLVDSVAAQLEQCIAGFEEPLKFRKLEADAAKAKAKADKESAERAARDAELRAQRQAEEDTLRVQREQESAALEQLRAEIASLKAAAAAEAEAQRAELAAARAQLEQERKAAAAEAASAARELQALRAEREAAQTRARLAAEAEEQREALELHEKEMEAKRQAALPDVAKLAAWATALLDVPEPSVMSPEAEDVAQRAVDGLMAIAEMLRAFDGTPETWQSPDPFAAMRTFGEVVDANVR